MNEISISTEFIKLDQFLKWAGLAEHGSAAKEMVIEGSIKVNGEVVLQRGKKLHKGDKIFVEGVGEYTIV